MQRRRWIESGIIECLDESQVRLLELVLEQIHYYYRELYGTRPCFRHPLSISRLKKLCNRSGTAIASAVRYLANSVPLGGYDTPPIYYDRVVSGRNPSHRPYRIYLRKR